MYDAELRLFHVVSNQSSNRDAESLIASLFALTRTLPARTRVSAALAHGNPSSEIIQHARLMRADLIVLGSEQRSAPVRFGNARRDVASQAGCPVLHVRPNAPTVDKAPGLQKCVLWRSTSDARTRVIGTRSFAAGPA